jgi:hypothetical protein
MQCPFAGYVTPTETGTIGYLSGAGAQTLHRLPSSADTSRVKDSRTSDLPSRAIESVSLPGKARICVNHQETML